MVLLLIPIATNPCVAKLLELVMDETTPSTYFNWIIELKCQVCYMHFLTIWTIFFQLCSVTTRQSVQMTISAFAALFLDNTYYSKYNQARYACHWCWNHKQPFLCFTWNFGIFLLEIQWFFEKNLLEFETKIQFFFKTSKFLFMVQINNEIYMRYLVLSL